MAEPKPIGPTSVVLSRPLPIAGANLAGRVRVGPVKPPRPTEGIQDRTLWVKAIHVEEFAVVALDLHGGGRMLLGPDTWSWVE